MKLIGAIVVGFILQEVVISIPVLANAFNVHNLPLNDWAIVLGFALIPLIVNEIIKLFMRISEKKEEVNK